MFTSWLIYLVVLMFVLAVIGFWVLNFFGLPGNWLNVGLAMVWIPLGPEEFVFSWVVVIVLAFLAGLGELLEFLASVVGAKKVGGSGVGATLSVIGSIIGGIVGALIGIPIPIPVVGVLISTILCAAIGALVGATLGEYWTGKSLRESLAIGKAAFLGRLVGTVGKITVGALMAFLVILAPFLF